MNVKLDNKGWGLSDYLIIVAALVAALVVASILVLHLTRTLKENVTPTEDININENIDNDEPDINNNDSNNEDNQLDNNTKINYQNIEQKLLTIGEKYIEVNYGGTISDGTIIVDNQHILSLDNNIENEMSNDNCKAYIVIKKEDTTISYTPFISCNNYKTDGYQDVYN